MSIFLSNDVIALIFSELLLFLFTIIALFSAVKIIRFWDFNSTSELQYSLEKRSFLLSTIIFFIIIIKIIIFLFFVFTIDNLSNIVPGAMCASGVVSANEYGNLTLFLKILSITILGVWLLINRLDMRAIDYPYTKIKFYLFLFISLVLFFELSLEFLYFSNISLEKPVLCCSVTFGTTGGGVLPFGLNINLLLILFYLFYALIVLSNRAKKALLSFVSSVIFLFLSYYALTYFFGTYIYELPTHKCPFCMLQSEYYHIGYILWGSLFLGLFFSMSGYALKLLINKEVGESYTLATIFNTIFVLLCSYFVVAYYIKNGVFL